jgi:hypothetical protein
MPGSAYSSHHPFFGLLPGKKREVSRVEGSDYYQLLEKFLWRGHQDLSGKSG